MSFNFYNNIVLTRYIAEVGKHGGMAEGSLHRALDDKQKFNQVSQTYLEEKRGRTA